jgi:hypothetical protein
VTRWGLILLLGFLALGLRSRWQARASTYVVWLVVVVMLYEGLRDGAL